MTINSKLENNILTLEVSGRLDTTTYSILDQAVAEHIDDVSRINFDFKNLEYVSSAGLRVILAVHKKLSSKDGLHLYNVNDDVKEVFDITGFLDILNIE